MYNRMRARDRLSDMQSFSEITNGAQILGLVPGNKPVWIITTVPIGAEAVTVYYKNESGKPEEQIVYQKDLHRLSIAEKELAWSFTADATNFRMALEAMRIQLGSLFDPMMAVHSSNIEPLPHQISAVYESMLPKQPLRFVLADDPGAGKTIMAGLLIKELRMRSDVERVLIVAPGSLTEQWQDELLDKFALEFKIFSNEQQNLSASGNYFADENLLIARIDQIARNEDYQRKLQTTQWDLIIVDEAHKMAAHAVGRDVKKTQRYQLGEMLSSITRHFLLMTATPHSGSDADFNLWLALVDPDRFYGVISGKDGYKIDVTDIMRRMVKEKLLKFDGTRLFPERIATTVQYTLSPAERDLYDRVTEYVVHEMNRAKRLAGAKGSQVGFALTVLQRRLASSPEAIYKSLARRLERMQKELKELQLRRAQEKNGDIPMESPRRDTSSPAWEDFDEDDLPPDEWEKMMDQILSASTATTIEELEKEVETLTKLAAQAKDVRDANDDRKWSKLSEMLRTEKDMLSDTGRRHKLIIFTEHKDTLDYLDERISGLLGSRERVRVISGSTNRESRRQVQEDFCNDPEVHVLIATDAAGEGVNLQQAHLLINYDLPWNPNRLEQRFGRIHRIGQTETCRMWNMVAGETREGLVFDALFKKLETERQALGGQVFDILGEAFKDKPLKELLLEAIADEATDKARRWMTEKVEAVLNHEALQNIMQRNMLVEQAMTKEALYAVKAELDKAEARKLQPYFVQAFFLEAYRSPLIGGRYTKREPERYEIRNVPATLTSLNRQVLQTRTPLAPRYERICFEKEYIRVGNGSPRAEFIHPGHPLMQTLTERVLREYQGLIKTGAVMVAPADDLTEPYLVVMVRHTVREASVDRPISQRLQFVRISQSGECTNAGWAPHLDFVAPKAEDGAVIDALLQQPWLLDKDWEQEALNYASAHLARDHYEEVRSRRKAQADKTQTAIRERLIDAINKYQSDARMYEAQIKAGKSQSHAQPANARKKADELNERLKLREAELEEMRHPVSSSPVALGCMLVVPQGYLNKVNRNGEFCVDKAARNRVEALAMQAVMEKERSFGYTVTDVSAENCGWDITSQPSPVGDIVPDDRHIEVKGRAKDATTITVSSNEVKTSLNQGDKFILAIVLVDGDQVDGPYYIRNPFKSELMDGQVSGNFSIADLLKRAVAPEATL